MKYLFLAIVLLAGYACLAALRLTHTQGPDLKPRHAHVLRLKISPSQSGFTSSPSLLVNCYL